MNPVVISAVIGILAELIKEEPAIAAEIQAIFAKPNPTEADWDELRYRVESEAFKTLCPDAKLPGE